MTPQTAKSGSGNAKRKRPEGSGGSDDFNRQLKTSQVTTFGTFIFLKIP
jgi:hypothetical protein